MRFPLTGRVYDGGRDRLLIFGRMLGPAVHLRTIEPGAGQAKWPSEVTCIAMDVVRVGAGNPLARLTYCAAVSGSRA